jgi:signal transduction histidine kinase
MYLLTQSQLHHYQIDCKTLRLKPSKLVSLSFQEYFTNFILPFQPTLDKKMIKVEISGPPICADLCTDFLMLEGILYHILSNAVKYADPCTIIQIQYCLEQISHPTLAGRLKIIVID